MSKKKACGYIRVSSKKQVDDGESLEAQEKAIKNYIESQGWDLVEIYKDAGKSGKDMSRREDLKRLLRDAHERRFDIAVIWKISRFGRSTVDSLNNMQTLKELGIRLISLKENLDFDSHIGKLLFTMLAAFAELDNEMRAEDSLAGKAVAAGKGRPVTNQPFGRTWNKEKGMWLLDDEKARLLRQAARLYLDGGSLSVIADDIGKKLGLKYGQLVTTLKDKCSGKWEIVLGGEKIVYNVPGILDDCTIKQINAKLEHNRTFNKKSYEKYLLGGFVRCMHCGKALTGQTQWSHGKSFMYYRHPRPKSKNEIPCRAINYINAGAIESAVFNAIFQNTLDQLGFEKAISGAFPKKHEVESLKEKVAANRKELTGVDGKLNELVDMVLAGQIRKETVKKKEGELYRSKEKLEEELERDQNRLDRFPSVELIKKDAERARLALQDYYQTSHRLKSMSFSEKRDLLAWLFPDSANEEGKTYGVYVKNVGKGNIYDYELNAVLFAGGNFLKVGKKSIDHDYWDDDMDELVGRRIEGYKTFLAGQDQSIP